ncbi:MAG: ComF family protein [Cytophagales bacterium]
MRFSIGTLWNDFLAQIFPEFCHSCHGEILSAEHLICTSCIATLPKTNHILEQQNELWVKFSNRIRFEYAIAYFKFYKKGKIQPLLHSLKYHNNQELGVLLGNMFGYDLNEKGFANKFDVLIPIPLHHTKLKKRGFNQCDVIAKGIAERLNITVGTDIVKRNQATKSQTKIGKTERWENVADKFEVLKPEAIEGKHIVLLDDVVTTGATFDALAEVILKYNPSKISILALAEAQRY